MNTLEVGHRGVPKIRARVFQSSELEKLVATLMVLRGMVSWSSLIVSWVATRVKYHLIVTLHGDLVGRWYLNLVPEYGWESVISVVLGYLCEDQLHRLVLAEACTHPLILEKLVVALEVLSVAIGLQDQVVCRPGLKFGIILLVHLAEDVLNEFLGGGDQRLFEPDLDGDRRLVYVLLSGCLKVVPELGQIDDGVDISHPVEGLAQLTVEDVAWVVRGLILQELPREMSSSVQVSLPLEIPGEVLEDQ